MNRKTFRTVATMTAASLMVCWQMQRPEVVAAQGQAELYAFAATAQQTKAKPPAKTSSKKVFNFAVAITSTTGFNNLCPNTKLDYQYTQSGSGTVKSTLWSVSDGTIDGPNDQSTVTIKWMDSPAGGYVYVVVTYTDGTDPTEYPTSDGKWVTKISTPLTTAPVVLGATLLNPNYVPVNGPATFTTSANSGNTQYTWSFPSCFSVSSTVTTSPSVTVSTTGTCTGDVCVTGANLTCGLNSDLTCLAIKRIPTLSPMQGPPSFCMSSSATYCTQAITGITSYVWTIPSGWKLNGSPASGPVTAGQCVQIAAPTTMSSDLSGTVSVYGVVASVGNTSPQSKPVTINFQSPSTLAKVSPVTTVTATPNASKKSISITFPTMPFSYVWSYAVSGLGINPSGTVNATVTNAGTRSFLMTNNQDLVISTSTQNSCGVLPGNSYYFKLKNGALVPQAPPP